MKNTRGIVVLLICFMHSLAFCQTRVLYADSLRSFYLSEGEMGTSGKLFYQVGDSLELVVGGYEGAVIEGLFYKDSIVSYLVASKNGAYVLCNQVRYGKKPVLWPSYGSFHLSTFDGEMVAYSPDKRLVSQVKLINFNTLTWVETIWTETDEVESKYKITALVNFGPKEAQRRKKLIMANRGVSGEQRRQLLIDLHKGNFKVLERVAVE